jgi:three-Cys-motif partner protein
MEPKTTLWKLEPHTLGKHLVLKKYLDAWLPIMGRWNGRILFIDGFAGPGEYKGGEDGSPLIALRALKEHRAKGEISAEVYFFFIEKDVRRAKHLERLVSGLKSCMPPNCQTVVVHGVFDETMTQALDELEAQREQLAPCFVMADPFGVSGTPMSVMRRILQNPKSEVYISFMYEFINRFKGTSEFEPHLDQLFGSSTWREGIKIRDSDKRKRFFYDLYKNQLRQAGAQHVVHFELYKGRRLVYTIFFATQHTKGCDLMKQAIWKVAPWGDFAFRGMYSGQLTLGLEVPDFRPLKEALRQNFRSKGWVCIEEVNDFVASDQTDYHTGQFKRGALVPMEDAKEVEVDDSTRKRKHTYPAGTRLRFP